MHVVVKLGMVLTSPLAIFALRHRMLPSSFASHCWSRSDALGAWVRLNPMPGGVGVHEQASAFMLYLIHAWS